MQNSISVVYRPNGGIHYQSVCICSAGRNQGGKHALAPPPKFSKTCFVVRYNNKSQSFCTHRKYQLVASLLSGIHEHAMGAKQCFSLKENTRTRAIWAYLLNNTVISWFHFRQEIWYHLQWGTEPQPANIFWGEDCNLMLFLTTKHDFENFGGDNCPVVPLGWRPGEACSNTPRYLTC